MASHFDVLRYRISYTEAVPRLRISVREERSGEGVQEARIRVSGPVEAYGRTNSSGYLDVHGLRSGSYEIEITESECDLSGEAFRAFVDVSQGVHFIECQVRRVLRSVRMCRKHIRFDGERLSDKDNPSLLEMKGALKRIWARQDCRHPDDMTWLDVGHWWTLVYESPGDVHARESYGWYPDVEPNGLKQLIAGMSGRLNDHNEDLHGHLPAEYYDPHHLDPLVSVDEHFFPLAETGANALEIKDAIRGFAFAFRGIWSYRGGFSDVNCHTFQDDLMRQCRLGKPVNPGVKWIGRPPTK